MRVSFPKDKCYNNHYFIVFDNSCRMIAYIGFLILEYNANELKYSSISI
jgi:hypothetical protein